jgi:hypothetical protein
MNRLGAYHLIRSRMARAGFKRETRLLGVPRNLHYRLSRGRRHTPKQVAAMPRAPSSVVATSSAVLVACFVARGGSRQIRPRGESGCGESRTNRRAGRRPRSGTSRRWARNHALQRPGFNIAKPSGRGAGVWKPWPGAISMRQAAVRVSLRTRNSPSNVPQRR